MEKNLVSMLCFMPANSNKKQWNQVHCPKNRAYKMTRGQNSESGKPKSLRVQRQK